LRDRMEVIELAGYSEEEKLAIAQKHLLPRQVTEHGLLAAQLDVPPQTLKKLIRSYTREAGVRELTRELAAVCRKIALQVAEGTTHSARARSGDVQRLLGIPRFDAMATELDELVGVSTGLAGTRWGAVGPRGEATAMPAR